MDEVWTATTRSTITQSLYTQQRGAVRIHPEIGHVACENSATRDNGVEREPHAEDTTANMDGFCVSKWLHDAVEIIKRGTACGQRNIMG